MTAKEIIRDRLLDAGVRPTQILAIEQDFPWPTYAKTVGILVVSRSDSRKDNTFICPRSMSNPNFDYWFDTYGTTEFLPP